MKAAVESDDGGGLEDIHGNSSSGETEWLSPQFEQRGLTHRGAVETRSLEVDCSMSSSVESRASSSDRNREFEQ